MYKALLIWQQLEPKDVEIAVDNPVALDLQLILMIRDHSTRLNEVHFDQKCKVKDHLISLIIDNGSDKSLVSKMLVSNLQLLNTNHSIPYQLGWV